MIASASSPSDDPRRDARGGSSSTMRSSRSPVPSPCSAETAIGPPKPSFGELRVDRGRGRRRFGLVGGEHHRAALAPQNGGDVFVERMQSGLRVDDEDDDVGFRGGCLGLPARDLGEPADVRQRRRRGRCRPCRRC